MNELEKALLWVIYEQCVYGGKAYAKLLIHGEDAFRALGLEDECDVKEIEKRLFEDDKAVKRTCRQCRYRDDYTGACGNEYSSYYANFMKDEDTCEGFE